MTKPYDGGPAFPHQFQDVMGHPDWRQSTGMTLRDWFAGQALAGIASAAAPQAISDLHGGVKMGMREAIAAYAWADAMLEARGK